VTTTSFAATKETPQTTEHIVPGAWIVSEKLYGSDSWIRWASIRSSSFGVPPARKMTVPLTNGTTASQLSDLAYSRDDFNMNRLVKANKIGGSG